VREGGKGRERERDREGRKPEGRKPEGRKSEGRKSRGQEVASTSTKIVQGSASKGLNLQGREGRGGGSALGGGGGGEASP
jgi:hypothetical protein